MSLVESTVTFCRALRERGLLVSPEHAWDAVRALQSVGLETRAGTYHALKCVLASRPEDFETFDELFDELFARPEDMGGPPSLGSARKRRAPHHEPIAPSLHSWGAHGESDEPEPEEVPGASDARSLSEKDFSAFGSEELAEIERIAARIARRLAARPSRRWKSGARGPRIDLRRTMRRSLAQGEAVELRFRRRKTRKTRIVAICDVSGSMDLYSRLLLQFLFALQGSVARVESFVFATELRRVTEALRGRSYGQALAELAREVRGWSGGTRIGESLAAFNEEYGHLVDRRTVVVILSDGWETGDPAVLEEAVQQLHRRSRRLVWLNPLLGSPGYEPLTLGMQAALPHVSVFAPAHNLQSLRGLERHLL